MPVDRRIVPPQPKRLWRRLPQPYGPVLGPRSVQFTVWRVGNL